SHEGFLLDPPRPFVLSPALARGASVVVNEEDYYMKNAKRWLPGAFVSILLIIVILYFVDLRAMLEAIRNANYGLLGIALVIGFIWMAVRAVVWRTLLRERASYSD